MNVLENISDDKYEPKMVYPSAALKPRLSSYASTSIGAREYADALEKYEKVEEEIRAARTAYRVEKTKLMNQFKLDLQEENGIPENHPKAEVLFGMAWEDGHDEGLYNVVEKYEKYLQLITK